MYHLKKIQGELDEQIERYTEMIQSKPGLSYEDFVGLQATIRAFKATRSYTEELEKEGEEADG
jgi:hypothetical protein